MRHQLSPLNRIFRYSSTKSRFLSWSGLWLSTLSVSILLHGGLNPQSAQAESPATAPPQLKSTLAQIDAAANKRDVQAILQFYDTNFTHSDGLTRQSLAQALTQLWQQYPKLTYRTELKSWQNQGKDILVETITYINGVQKIDGKEMTLAATLRSQQRLAGQKIVRQEILAERSQLSSGAKPPAVEINLPEQVSVGQTYNFDAIVKEPLGDSILMGAAVEEPVRANSYFSPTPVDLELLPAGGIFKVGRAPTAPDNRWVSAVLVRENGMVMITQRLRIVTQK